MLSSRRAQLPGDVIPVGRRVRPERSVPLRPLRGAGREIPKGSRPEAGGSLRRHNRRGETVCDAFGRNGEAPRTTLSAPAAVRPPPAGAAAGPPH